jgi:hypothetical protein
MKQAAIPTTEFQAVPPAIRLIQWLMNFSLAQTSHVLESCREFMIYRKSVQRRSPGNSTGQQSSLLGALTVVLLDVLWCLLWLSELATARIAVSCPNEGSQARGDEPTPY